MQSEVLSREDWQWLADQLRAWPLKRVHPDRTMCEATLRPMAADVIEAALVQLAEAADEIDRLRALTNDAPDKALVEALRECDWPEGGRFTFHDEPGEHDPCYVVMPGGAALALNHHAGEGVDIARAKFIIAACNAALTTAPTAPNSESPDA